MRRAALACALAVALAGCGGDGEGEGDGSALLDRVDATYERLGGVEISGRVPGNAQNPGFDVRTTVVLDGGVVVAKEVVRTTKGRGSSRLLITAPEGPSYDWSTDTACWNRHPPLESIPAEELTQLDARVFHTAEMTVHDVRRAGGSLLLPVDFDVPTESTWGDLPVLQRAGYSGHYVLRVDPGSARVQGLTFSIGAVYGEEVERDTLRYEVASLAERPELSTPEPLC